MGMFRAATTASQTFGMTLFVDQPAVQNGANLIDGIGKLQTAVFDMHRSLCMRQITAIDVSNAS